jgi:hypothetical protein
MSLYSAFLCHWPGGNIGHVHVRVTVRVCADQYLNSLQFADSGAPRDTQVTHLFLLCRGCPSLKINSSPSLLAMHSGIDFQIPVHAVQTQDSRSWDSVVHGRDSGVPNGRNISCVHVHGKWRERVIPTSLFYHPCNEHDTVAWSKLCCYFGTEQVLDCNTSPMAQFSMFIEVLLGWCHRK